MKQELKQHIIKTLDFLKNHQEFDELTLNQIQERLIEYESLLIEFVEQLLEDKEDLNGTLTTWWLFENVEKKFYYKSDEGDVTLDVESPEDFVTYILNLK